MADVEASAPETPKGPDTLGDPTLIEADEALRRISEAEGKQQDRLEDKNLILKMLTTSLDNVILKTREEFNKTPRDFDKLQKLSEREEKLTVKRNEWLARADKKADAKEAELATGLDASAKKLESDLVEMKKLQDKQTALNAQLTPEILASQVPADNTKRTAIYGELKEVAAALKPYESAGTYEKQTKIQEARVEMRKKAEAMEKAERNQEAIIMERDLRVGLAEALGEPAPPVSGTEPADSETGDKPALTDEEKAKEKELILDNKIDQIAFDLATMLAGNVPNEDDTFGKFSFEAKRGLLMVMTFLGGDPAWAMTLSESERKALGMTVTTKLDEKGDTVHNIKWDPIDMSGNDIQDVYEAAFGKDGWEKQMKLLTPTTTVKDLQEKVAAFPSSTTDPEQQNMIKFVKALEAEPSGATSASGVQEYIKANSDKIIKILKPETATATGAAPESVKPDLDEVKIITDNHIKNDTPFIDLMKAAEPDLTIPEGITAKTAPAKAKEVVARLTSTEKITAYQDQLRMAGVVGKMFGIPDLSDTLASTFATAHTEMKKDGKLSDATKTTFESGVKDYLIAFDGLLKKPCNEVLTEFKSNLTEEAEKKAVEAMLAALEANSKAPAAPESAPVK